MKTDEKLLLAFIGVAIVGGVIYFATKAPAAATPVLPRSTRVTAVGPAEQHVGITAGLPTINVSARLGDTVILELPPGGAWQAGGTAVMPAQIGTSTPISWVYAGPGTVVLVWSSPTTGTVTTNVVIQTM
jgi:hypothetical protein